jgi:predicted dehydrogenase
MAKKIGVGIIGANIGGSWAAAAHLPALAALSEDYELRAVSTTRAESAQAAAAELGVAAYDNHDALLAHPGVDLVVVSVRASRHRELVLAALGAGKHVLCEWPLGNGLAESIELAEAAKDTGKVAAVGLQGRFSPYVLRMRDLVREGYVGDVVSTSLVASCWVYDGSVMPQLTFMTDLSEGSNFVSVQLGHVSDAVAFCVGEFKELNATLTTVRPDVRVQGSDEVIRSAAPDHISLSGVLTNGASASIHLRGGRPKGTTLLWEVNGTAGDLVLTGPGCHFNNDDEGVPVLCGATAGDESLTELEVPDSYRVVPSETPAGPPYNVAQLYAALARDIREGTALCATFEHAARRHQLLGLVEEAAATGERRTYEVGPDGQPDIRRRAQT